MIRTSVVVVSSVAAGLAICALAAPPVIALSSHQLSSGSAHQGMGQGNGQGNRQGMMGSQDRQGNRGQGNGQGNRQGNGQGNGQGNRQGMMGFQDRQGNRGQGNGQGMGAGLNLTGVASGILTTDQKTKLAGMAEEEKMAHDLYVALAAKYPSVHQFSNISQAETRHLDAVRQLLTRYQVPDPTAGKAPGVFDSTRIQTLYNKLLASASSSSAALAAGVTVEKTDIADLKTASSNVTAPDVVLVYKELTNGSEHHLKAFGG